MIFSQKVRTDITITKTKTKKLIISKLARITNKFIKFDKVFDFFNYAKFMFILNNKKAT